MVTSFGVDVVVGGGVFERDMSDWATGGTCCSWGSSAGSGTLCFGALVSGSGTL
jgi:hypothetical protein